MITGAVFKNEEKCCDDHPHNSSNFENILENSGTISDPSSNLNMNGMNYFKE
ncbi:18828_t:CDS:2 [Acaulospora morrowiae]|uniref:18828_t:CDS:1 n=1 Tax=Acaulospora morrowiae TaxID=94023 RepID=A0A9N9D642_9GLOM|nr:18828_t:CDS:2 [Acaulospora morrowiae]